MKDNFFFDWYSERYKYICVVYDFLDNIKVTKLYREKLENIKSKNI